MASSQGPIEFQNYPAYLQSDSDTFATNVGVPKFSVPSSQIIGPFSPEGGADESELDEQVRQLEIGLLSFDDLISLFT
jgi:hypothetical protein